MNLRPTKLKVIWSVIFTAAIYVLSNFVFTSNTGISRMLDIFNLTPLSTTNIIIFFVTLIVIYLILSIFHSKNNA